MKDLAERFVKIFFPFEYQPLISLLINEWIFFFNLKTAYKSI